MTTIAFVHGTGVRGAAYSRVFKAFQSNVRERDADIAVVPCGWGEHLGTSFAFGGASIPGHDRKPGRRDPSEVDMDPDAEDARWTVLAADPLHDLRFLAISAREGRASALTPPGVRSVSSEIRARLEALPGQGTLARELADRDLLPYFESAVAEVSSAIVTQQAIKRAAEPTGALVSALAEAIIAAMLRQAAQAEGMSVPLHGGTRTHLTGLLLDRLGYGRLSLFSTIGGLAARVALRTGTWALDRWRQPLSDGAQPALGDIVWYLARGAALRAAIAAVASAPDDDVVLVGHSLGGIACLDLLLTTSLPSVRTLVTVGSQGPLLFELDALPGLRVGAEVPATLPPWVNYYDQRDMLSYLATPVFGDRASDIRLDNGRYMPESHSAYFDNKEFYDSLLAVIAAAPAERAGG